MFVSIVLEPGSMDSARNIVNLLSHTGFSKVQKTCWENSRISEAELTDIKKEIDRYTDYYDNVRIYQFPLEGKFVITELKEKKWRRCVLNSASPRASNSEKNASSTGSVKKSRPVNVAAKPRTVTKK